MSEDVFDRALDRRDAVIEEQRRRIKALEAFLKRLREWDQMNPPMTGDHGAFAASIDRLLKEADR
ncbi:MAG: hypothetical protein IOD05_16275 [Rhodobacter sp.]|nr:hypothetical protein [Rhodobacter sp.]